MKGLRRFFGRPPVQSALHLLLIMGAVVFNGVEQVFCRPVPWAWWVLALVLWGCTTYPIVRHRQWSNVLALVNGISAVVWVYCIVFLGELNLLGLLLVLWGVGLLTFVPHFLLLRLLWAYLIRPRYSGHRFWFSGGIVLSLGILLWAGLRYQEAHQSVARSLSSTDLYPAPQGWMEERIVGMHFLYHTEVCIYDGWRPPMHDPLLVAGRWLNGGVDPIQSNLEDRVRLYRQWFPERPVKLDCSCAHHYRASYHGAALWDMVNGPSNR